ncbi:uncharacterized protein (DUF2384 family) [Novosphingobium sp. 1748]|uniref:hypothetical protein n=1 Tax=Novosphingobium sp. 1748 TaxID=2817760 RepID=UPI00285EDCEA|nr:hypothetical protein [Novosphingobium sp. 1748]MDR6709272.1 uncharacterized protein (DUF2384 family) [Novosphingobium sp. 1748]
MSITCQSAPLSYRRFVHRPKQASPLTSQYLDRQSMIANLAYMHLGGSKQAISFLNQHNFTLGAKPLDLAGDSNEGYVAVCSEILRLVPL